MDRIIPWQDLKALIGPYYREGKLGAQPYPLELMIRIHFLQLVYNVSDPMYEETLHDSFACRRFVGLTMDVLMKLRFCASVISLRKTVWTNKSLICSSSSFICSRATTGKGIYLFMYRFHLLIRLLKAIRRITDQDSFKGSGLRYSLSKK